MAKTQVVEEIVPPPAEFTIPLNAKDRCDRGDCSAQAYVRVHMTSGGELLFCAHHYTDTADKLVMITAHVHDQRSALEPPDPLHD